MRNSSVCEAVREVSLGKDLNLDLQMQEEF
jgi:hypothetical protein